MYATYAERKIAAFLQDRMGPNRAGPFGIFQPLADGGKLFFKEEIIPLASSKFLFILGLALAMLTAMLTSAVIPWGTPLHIIWTRCTFADRRYQYWDSLHFWCCEFGCLWNYDRWMGIE